MVERNRKSHRYWIAGITVGFLAIAGAGCKKETAQPPDTGVAATLDTTLLPEDPGLDDVPGRDAAKTRAYLAKLRPHWTVAQQSVAIDCESECVPNRDTIHIAIYTHKLTWKLDAKKLVERSNSNNNPGHFALKIVNLDSVRFTPLGLLPHDTAYLWGGKVDTTIKRAFAFYRVDPTGGAVLISKAFRAIHCQLPQPPTSSDAHLQPKNQCEADATAKDSLYADTPPPNFKQPIHDQGMWFSCTGGCCQASTFGQ